MSSRGRTGLVRNSVAPAFIARTVVGMSPCPVRKTIGISTPRSAISRCRSRPLPPGMRTSSTRQAGPPARATSRKSRADAKLRTLRPCERTSRSVERRSDASSSTTNTVAPSLSTGTGALSHAGRAPATSARSPLLVRMEDEVLALHRHVAGVPTVGGGRVGRELVRGGVVVEERVSPSTGPRESLAVLLDDERLREDVRYIHGEGRLGA